MKIWALHIILVLSSLSAMGQQISSSCFAIKDQLSIHPGYAGFVAKDAFGSTQYESWIRTSRAWQGVDQSPEMLFVDANLPLSHDRYGLGLQFESYHMDVFRQQQVVICGAYHINWMGGRLGGGAGLSLFQRNAAVSQLNIQDIQDPTYQGDLSATALDVNGGVFFQHQKGYAGVSVMHAGLQQTTQTDLNVLAPMVLNLSAGYNFKLSKTLLLQPNMILRMGFEFEPLYEAYLKFSYKEKLEIIGGYKNNNYASYGLFVAPAGFTKWTSFPIGVGYSYNQNIGQLNLPSGHELALQILIAKPPRLVPQDQQNIKSLPELVH